MLTAAALASTLLTASPAVRLVDATGDVRLRHPEVAGLERGTFDLVELALSRDAQDRVVVEATFAAPVRQLTGARVRTDEVIALYPQTVDVYLDLVPDAGQVATLPGRLVHVPAAEAWDAVLVLSSVRRAPADGATLPLALTAHGRTLRGVFPAGAVVGTIRGVLALVLATSPRSDGGVRGVGNALTTDCRTFDRKACLLTGDAPPVLDATGAVGLTMALVYLDGQRPDARRTPVVYARGVLVNAAPAPPATTVGTLATLHDAGGVVIGTAVVEGVVGEVLALRWLGEPG